MLHFFFQLTTAKNISNYESFYETAQFVTGLILFPTICIFGISGNILTLIVLSNKNMITSTNTFLSALSIADLIKLFNDTLYWINLILIRTNPTQANTMMGYVYPISHYIFNESVCVCAWLTVSVAAERYIFICKVKKKMKRWKVNINKL